MSLTPPPDPVWIVGPVTDDVIAEPDGASRSVAGGAALYTARASEALGVRAHVLCTSGPAHEALRTHEIARVDASMLTLRHEFVGGDRQQTLVQASSRTLSPSDCPSTWPEPSTLLLAPLLPENIDVPEFLDEYPGAEVALLGQGLQRAVLPDGRIANRAQPSSTLLDAARPNVSIFLAEEEVRLWPAGALAHLVARSARVVVTAGAQGARVLTRAGEARIPAERVEVVDATGAGDVFAAAYILAVRAGEEFAGRVAAALAAAACEVQGPGVLPSLDEIESRFHVRLPPGDVGAADGGRRE